MVLMASRRSFLGSALSLLAAPAIVKIASIMPVKEMPVLGPVEEALQESWDRFHFGWADWRGIYGNDATS